jgi:hypothetical protein
MKHFLRHSTVSQLQTYVSNYKPAILQSIQRAKHQQSKSKRIYQFLGFQALSRHPKPTPPTQAPRPGRSHHAVLPMQHHTIAPQIASHQTTIRHAPFTQVSALNPYNKKHAGSIQPSQTSTNQGSSIQTTTLSPQKRESPHRKHSRWKPSLTEQTRFKAYFHKPFRITPTNHCPT